MLCFSWDCAVVPLNMEMNYEKIGMLSTNPMRSASLNLNEIRPLLRASGILD